MIVSHDKGTRISREGFLEDFSGVDGCMGQGAPKELLALNEVQARVPVEAKKDLMGKVTILKYPCHESGLIPLGCKIAGVADCQNGEVSLGLKLRRFFL
jgi:hypothetical protein